MRHLLAAALVTLLLGAGCGGDDDGQAGNVEPTTTSAAAGPGGLTAADITPLSVELVDPGREPRAPLAGDVADLRASTAQFRFDLAVEGVTSAQVEGMSRVGAPGEVADDGTATVRYGLGGLDVALTVSGTPAGVARDALAMNWQLVVGPGRSVRSGTVQTITSGNLPGVDTVAGSLDPRLTSLLLPFPTEPVGVGSRWRVEGPLPMFGATVVLEAELELVQRRGARFTIEAALAITTPEAGATADITLQGTGELVGDVHQLGLRRGRVTMAGTIAQPDGGADPIPFPSTLVVSIDQPEGG